VGGVIVNQVIEVDDRDRAPEFVRNRMDMQEEHLGVIREEFEDQVRAVVPLYDDEIRGVPALEKASSVLLR
jgi:anion-transporting  ArsA/GET3 family ATPase